MTWAMSETATSIWKRYHGRLRGFIHQRVRNEADADDILQDVFGKIPIGQDRLENREKLEAWVFRVTRRTIIDHFRRLVSSRRASSGTPEIAETLPTPTVSCDLAACLRPMLEATRDQDREALQLTELEGMTQEGLAARLGLSLTGAKSRVQRPRRQLKEALLACCRLDYVPRRSPCSGG